MAKGKVVKWYNDSGEIQSTNGIVCKFKKKDMANKKDIPSKGDKVEFDISQSSSTFDAINVRIVDKQTDTTPNAEKPIQGMTKLLKIPDRTTFRHPENRRNRHQNMTQERQVSPYNFYKREDKRINGSKLEQSPTQFHDRLNEDCYDIAFEIEWETLTETAANPCQADVPECAIEDIDGYKGYNKRWLMFDCDNDKKRLAISPFTVKSAIANGFANLMGSCYRVNTKKEARSNFEPGQYPYGGGYKRYRVSMDNKSFPGIIAEDIVTTEDGKFHVVKIYPVTEYYYDQRHLAPFSPKSNQEVSARTCENNHKKFVTAFELKGTNGYPDIVRYWGHYRFGMNNSFKGGQRGKNHFFRFYKYKEIENGTPCFETAYIPSSHFGSLDDLKKLVYVGTWYENLRTLKKGDWVYYEEFKDADGKPKITNIGKNFLFKALFLHEDTVPSSNAECKKVKGDLCPRCSMFGLTEKEEKEGADEKNKEIVGFRGRFKSSALMCNEELFEVPDSTTIEVPVTGEVNNERVTITHWKNNKGEVRSSQVLLPIQGPPKPNKRDVQGTTRDGTHFDCYYEEKTGQIKGAKRYLHAAVDSTQLMQKTNRAGVDYSHKLRNFVQVCESCMKFTGTVGAENCNLDEIAAFIVLLETEYSENGFKIGQGKAFGLGSIKSSIKKVWIRKKNYDGWEKIPREENIDFNKFIKGLDKYFTDEDKPGSKLSDRIKLMKGLQKQLNVITNMDNRELFYQSNPRQLSKYWEEFYKKMV